MFKIKSFPTEIKDIKKQDTYRFNVYGDEFPFDTFEYFVDMKIVGYGTDGTYTTLEEHKKLQQRIDNAIEYIETEKYDGTWKLSEMDLGIDLLDILSGKDNDNKF